jgi:hypothetical protein
MTYFSFRKETVLIPRQIFKEKQMQNIISTKRPRSKVMTQKKLVEMIRKGFGQGHGNAYQPWLKIRRKNSSPTSNQVVAWMPPLKRTAHYFSRGEFHMASVLLWLGVQDLREQYPLWPIAHPHPMEGAPGSESLELKWSHGLLRIADEAGIKHGVEVGTNIPYVATIDLLATVQLDSLKLFGFSSKPISNPDDEIKMRTMERMELERRYLAEIDAGYYVTNSAFVPSVIAGQLECWLDCSTLHCAPELLPLAEGFADSFNKNNDLSIAEAVRNSASYLSISVDAAWLLFRYCAWNQTIDIDPSVQVVTSHPVKHGGLALRSQLRKHLFGEDWQ